MKIYFKKIIDDEYIAIHINRIQKIKNLNFQLLITSRDFNPYGKKYTKYRAIPSEYFLPIYIYDRKF